MGLITKYLVEFPEAALTVSNDVFSGEFILDADIEVEMVSGRGGTAFTIKIYDLPEDKIRAIDQVRSRLKAVQVRVKLGYFDGDFEPVLEGYANKLEAKAASNRLVTTLKGLESGTYALTHSEVSTTIPADTSIENALRQVLRESAARRDPSVRGEVDSANPSFQSLPAVNVRSRAVAGRTATVLERLAAEVGAEMVLTDRTLRIGLPVQDDTHVLNLVPDENLVGFQPFKKTLPKEIAPYKLHPLPATEVEGVEIIALGDPKLRPAQRITAGVEGYESLTLRLASIKHSFTLASGYLCRGVAMTPCTDGACRERVRRGRRPSAETIAAQLSSTLEDLPRKRPFVDVGKIKQYLPGSGSENRHRADLYYRQRAEDHESQPSIHVDVDADENQVYLAKPVAAPFAWHKCGLMVPVYPGMKAVLLHNLGLRDDALVGGFTWSETPALQPPANQPGDYWLCLPIDPPDDGPQDSTKAANDLTAKNGKRVVEAKGFTLTIGASKLRNVGERPAEGGDDELLIDHASGTRIHIDSSGKVTIKAQGGIEIEGDAVFKSNVVFEGNVDIQ